MVEQIDPQRVMSPRRLEKMSNAGSKIMKHEMSNKRAANYANAKTQQMMDELNSRASHMNNLNSAKQIKPPLYEEPYDSESNEQPTMHLVPCRWEHSGWKYVQVDPKNHNFFNNPNRINSHGISNNPKRASRHQSVKRESYYGTSQKSAFAGVSERKQSDTTYGRFFS